jgi:hypothetical protein
MSSPSAKESNRDTRVSRQGHVTKSQAQSGMRADAFPTFPKNSDVPMRAAIVAARAQLLQAATRVFTIGQHSTQEKRHHAGVNGESDTRYH